MNMSQERFEEQFHQESDEEREVHQDETADESQLQEEVPDSESESESDMAIDERKNLDRTPKIRRRTEQGDSSESASKWESSDYHECMITGASDQH
uniref:RNA-binding protein 33 n=1 Tax=Haemonchus contortus TaxID=6289 RepID=A0A7I5E6D4_HAECO